jgi:UDP-2-acetamido-2,6-beta-L-arabino-hexul-4-ose reductase
MNVLVTGAKGFIGKNLCLALANAQYTVFEYDLTSTDEDLKKYLAEADWIVHLAGINRPITPEEFIDGNVNFTKKLLDLIVESGSEAPIIFSSSTQAVLDNPYGQSKKAAEEEILAFSQKQDHPVYIFRFYNAFGKWCRPNYNSVIATFCYNISHGLPITINEQAPAIDFVYIDDIVASLLSTIKSDGKGSKDIIYPEPHYSVRVNQIAEALKGFKASRTNFMVPEISDPFFKKLYSTYLSYLDERDFAYPLLSHKDQRGSFTEILKTVGQGQISVNISRPGITKGNHYHMSKNEKYLVVSGLCEIKFRKVGAENVITYKCGGDDLKVVDIPPGYTHSITNVGKDDSITLMWANECYDPNIPDTFFLPVEETKQ